MRRYTDAQLTLAIEGSRSWRGVLRALGLKGDSAGAMRAARRRAEELGLSFSHFTGQRRWSDPELAEAVASAASWTQVASALGLSSGSAESLTTLRGHALRLGIDAAHLEPRRVPEPGPSTLVPTIRHLARAGTLIAAAWFELCGCRVSWPLEPCRYDLLIWRDQRAERIQVKTTTRRCGATWTVQLRTNRKQTHTYGPDEIDQFFIIAGDYSCYLIPLRVVGGYGTINLAPYSAYRVQSVTPSDR